MAKNISSQDIVDGCEKTADRIREKLEAETGQEWRVLYEIDGGVFPNFWMFTRDYLYQSGYRREIRNWLYEERKVSDYFEPDPLLKLADLFECAVCRITREVIYKFSTREGSELAESGKQKWEWAKSFEGKRMEAR